MYIYIYIYKCIYIYTLCIYLFIYVKIYGHSLKHCSNCNTHVVAIQV